MIYAEFYHYSTGYIPGSVPPRFDGPKRLIPACGDRSVIILDGRERSDSHHRYAREEAIKRGYQGYTLNKGRNLIDSHAITEIIEV